MAATGALARGSQRVKVEPPMSVHDVVGVPRSTLRTRGSFFCVRTDAGGTFVCVSSLVWGPPNRGAIPLCAGALNADVECPTSRIREAPREFTGKIAAVGGRAWDLLQEPMKLIPEGLMDLGRWPSVGVFRAVPLDPAGDAPRTVLSRACDRIVRDDALLAAFRETFPGPGDEPDVPRWLDEHPDRHGAFMEWYTQRLLGPKGVDGYPIVHDMVRLEGAVRVSEGIRGGTQLCIISPDGEIRRATVVGPRISDASVECSFAYRGDDAGSVVYRLTDEPREWRPFGFLADGDYSGARCVLLAAVFHATIKGVHVGGSVPLPVHDHPQPTCLAT